MLKKGKKREAPSKEETVLYDRITKLEAQIMERIQKLKTNTRSNVCEHFSLTSPDPGPYQNSVNYYDRFWKRFLINEIGKQNLLDLREDLDAFERRLSKIEGLFGEWQLEVIPFSKTKKKGSKMGEGSQSEVCPFCQKSYVDEEALLIHIKIKHEEQEIDSNDIKDQSQSIFEQENSQ